MTITMTTMDMMVAMTSVTIRVAMMTVMGAMTTVILMAAMTTVTVIRVTRIEANYALNQGYPVSHPNCNKHRGTSNLSSLTPR